MVFNEKQSKADITYVINEGPRYVVQNISIVGNSKIEEAKLREKLARIESLFAGATTAGERIAAAEARKRIQLRLQSAEQHDPRELPRTLWGARSLREL